MISSRISKKDGQYNGQEEKRQKTKGPTMIYKTLHEKLNVEQNEPQ